LLLKKISEWLLRAIVIVLGLALTIGLLVRGH
jgi:hypothetical protein